MNLHNCSPSHVDVPFETFVDMLSLNNSSGLDGPYSFSPLYCLRNNSMNEQVRGKISFLNIEKGENTVNSLIYTVCFAETLLTKGTHETAVIRTSRE